jgi:DNA repair protein RadC
MAAAGELLGIPVLDHVIVAGDRWTSFASQGLL